VFKFKTIIVCLLLSVNCYGIAFNQNEATVLERFFRTMLLQSEGGYVLYDTKPICINGFYAVDRFFGDSVRHQESVDLREGAKVWKKNIEAKNDNIIIHVYDGEDSFAKNYIHILFINKNLFLKTVQANLSLFQYVLGPSVTPQGLLNKLIDPKETFHSVLKNDTVLIGILLGFGTQNALYGSRTEQLQEYLQSYEQPPMKNILLESNTSGHFCKETLLLSRSSDSDSKSPLQPSFSYFSLKEELSNLIKKMDVSSEQLSRNRPYFIFGKLKEDKETSSLIQELEKSQKAITSILSSKNFLDDVLKLVHPHGAMPKINAKLSSYTLGFTPIELKSLPFLVSMSILENLEDENEEFKQGFLLGMKDAQVGIESRFNDEGADSYDKLKVLNIARNNIKQADFYFSALDKEEDLNCILPKKIYYRRLEEGESAQLNNQTKVTIHCKIETPHATVIADTWKNNQPLSVNVNDIIPGLAWGMKGMQIGETRELFIHPSVGYGIYTLLEKGIYLKVHIKLLAFSENGESHPLPPLTSFDFNKDLDFLHQSNFEEVSRIAGYIQGYDIWNHYKKVDYYSLAQILGHIAESQSEEKKIKYESMVSQDLLNRLHWNIYHQETLTHAL
jgi:FKBP-type peptidyl-prolyl cis-trans isomerase